MEHHKCEPIYNSNNKIEGNIFVPYKESVPHTNKDYNRLQLYINYFTNNIIFSYNFNACVHVLRHVIIVASPL